MQHAPNAPGTARIGTVLSSRWRLIQKIGEGVTSEVYVGETIAVVNESQSSCFASNTSPFRAFMRDSSARRASASVSFIRISPAFLRAQLRMTGSHTL